MNAAGESAAAAEDLQALFRAPPASVRPRLWWHWIGGNVSPDGLTADLDWMKKVGVGGVTIFDVNLPAPRVVDAPLRYMTPEWRTAFSAAVRHARALDLEVGVAASPGWSTTGGPWVKPDDGMKKLTWSQIDLVGGRRLDVILPLPPGTVGPMLDASPAADPFAARQVPPSGPYVDQLVLAIPLDGAEHQALPAPSLSSLAGDLDGATLSDGRLDTGMEIAAGASWLEYSFPEPVTIRSATIAQAAGSIFAPTALTPTLAAEAGAGFTTLAQFSTGTAPQQTVSFQPVTARRFRLQFAPQTEPARLMEWRLTGAPMIDHFEDKAAFGQVEDLVGEPRAFATGVRAAQVVDVTRHMRADGRLRWRAPTGRWRLLRLGWSLTGKVNHPALAEATGLEVDKLDARAVERYMTGYLDRLASAAPLGPTGVGAITVDSIEVGAQNWTPGLLAQFRRRRGYDARPYMPAMTGMVIDTSARSDAFLFDMRRTIGELVAENHYGALTRSAHKRGLKVFSEAMEFARTAQGDDMAFRSFADTPMAAMWSFSAAAGPEPTALADMRGAASIAHLRGRPTIAAEVLTSIDALWSYSPADLRPMIDRAFAEGINLPVIHSSVHQPVDAQGPGLTLGVFGQTFNRRETWAHLARPWLDYVARTTLLLQRGRPVADVLYGYGEDAPLVALYGKGGPLDAPTTNSWDFVDPSTLLRDLRVEKGMFVAPSGLRYRLLWLGGSGGRMTLPMLRRLKRLAEQGGVIAGPRPTVSPSLPDAPAAFAKLVGELWGDDGAPGRILTAGTAQEALAATGAPKAFDAPPGVSIVQRRLPEGELFFVVNHSQQPLTDVWLGVSGRRPQLWRAEDARIDPARWTAVDGGARVAVDLMPGRSVFVLFGERTRDAGGSAPVHREQEIAELKDWSLQFPGEAAASAALGSWTELNAQARHFGGTATYTANLAIPGQVLSGPQTLTLDLGQVGDLAELIVNGQQIGVLWQAPWRADISKALRPGANQIQVRVTNLWINHLNNQPQPIERENREASPPPRPSGLLGPVRLFAVDEQGVEVASSSIDEQAKRK